MKPPRFVYFDPTTVAEALSLLQEHGEDGKVLAGGQSLIPVLNFRLSTPACLIDINGLTELDYVFMDDDSLSLGALTRHRTLERSPEIQAAAPLLTEAAHFIGHAAIRTRGTLGGSVSHADPAAELPVALTALDATIRIESAAEGVREVPVSEFFLAYMVTAMGPTDLLTGVRIPRLPGGMGWSFQEIARRSGDFALVSVAALLRLDPAGRIAECRLALGGVGGGPVRASQAEQGLLGAVPGPEAFAEAGRTVASEIDPDSDLHASAGLRRRLAAELTSRALTVALSRCEGGSHS